MLLAAATNMLKVCINQLNKNNTKIHIFALFVLRLLFETKSPNGLLALTLTLRPFLGKNWFANVLLFF